MDKKKIITCLLIIGIAWSFLVIGLGAYTRLTDSGLGCPDWPGCYGHLTVTAVSTSPINIYKAWAEMIHRYCAGILALMILFIVILGFSNAPFIAGALFLLLLYQPVLGMWTVTWKLAPFVVSQHLLCGMAIVALLFLMYLKTSKSTALKTTQLFWLTLIGVALVYLQIALGAWTSTHYAAISCANFPFCQLTPWHYNFREAFHIITPIGPNYTGGLISETAKKTIQMTHRFGALIVFIYWSVLFPLCVAQKKATLTNAIFWVMGLLMLQICLGISNVLLDRPLYIAVMHNLTAALLLLATIRTAFYACATTAQIKQPTHKS